MQDSRPRIKKKDRRQWNRMIITIFTENSGDTFMDPQASSCYLGLYHGTDGTNLAEIAPDEEVARIGLQSILSNERTRPNNDV